MKIKTYKNYLSIIAVLSVIFLLNSCVAKGPGGAVAKEELGDSVKISISKYSGSDAVEWEVTRRLTKEGTYIRDGIAKRYLKSGKLAETVNYVDNKREGMDTWYYASGDVYKEIMYKDNKRNGPFRYYDRKGRKLAEMEYYMGFPGVGLVEYYQSGKEKPAPKLVVSEINEIRQTGNYKIIASLSGEGIESVKRVTFYEGTLIDGKYFNEKAKGLTLFKELSSYKGELLIPVPRGSFVDEDINVIAVITTKIGGLKMILHKKVHVAVRGV